MGVRLRRLSERFKEKVGNRPPETTSNKRNQAMLKELQQHAAHVRHLERDLRALKTAAEIALKTTRETMASTLPRVYEDDAAVGSKATQAAVSVGGGASAEPLSAVSLEAGGQLGEEVFTPIARWQTTYNFLVARNKDLVNLRLEVDSRKRTVDELAAKVEGLRLKLGMDAGSSKAHAQLDSTTLKLQHKQGKLQVAQERYAQQEEDLHRQLSALAQDAIWLRNYACAALRIEGAMLSQAADAVGVVPVAAAAAAAEARATSAAAPGAALPTGPLSRSGTVAAAAAAAEAAAVGVPVSAAPDAAALHSKSNTVVARTSPQAAGAAGLVAGGVALSAAAVGAAASTAPSNHAGSVIAHSPTSGGGTAAGAEAGFDRSSSYGNPFTPEEGYGNPFAGLTPDRHASSLAPTTPSPSGQPAAAGGGTPAGAAAVGAAVGGAAAPSARPAAFRGAWVDHPDDLKEAPLPPQRYAGRAPAPSRVTEYEYHDPELDAAPSPPRGLPHAPQFAAARKEGPHAPAVGSAWTL